MRSAGIKKSKRLFVVASEKNLDERLYFNAFRPGLNGTFRVKFLPGPEQSATPASVVQRLLDYESSQRPSKDTEYWALVDRGTWPDYEMLRAWKMVQTHNRYHLAVSNPCFSLWIWLHLCPYRPFIDSRHCETLLKKMQNERGASGTIQELSQNAEVAYERARALADPSPWNEVQGTQVAQLVANFLPNLQQRLS